MVHQRLLLPSHVPSRMSLAASSLSKTRGPENATENNPARVFRRTSSSAAAAGKSGVGQILSRATGRVPQASVVSTSAIASRNLPSSRSWKTTTIESTWAEKVDLRQMRKEWLDD